MITAPRRSSLLVLLAALLALLTACTSSTGGSPASTSASGTGGAASGPGNTDTSRPNFVFVLTDDLSMNLVSHMKNLEQLAHDGTTMSNNYVVDSLCCPSRSAIFTGEFPHDDGVYTNNGSFGGYDGYNRHGDQAKSFALALQQRGYRTAMMGKYLNGYSVHDKPAPGWNEWDVADKGYSEFNYDLNENGTIKHYGTGDQNYLTNVVSAKAGTFIESTDQPFLLEVATFAPHGPYTPAHKYAGTYHGSYPRTPAYDTLPGNAPSWLAGRTALTARNTKKIDTIWQKRVEAVQSVDDMIGHLRQVLAAKGVANNTYVVFSSDNGYHMGEYRLLPGKQTAFDTDIHVPLVVTGPHVTAGRTATQLTSEIDLAPTFEALAGAKIGTGVDGTSMADLWHGANPSGWQQSVLIEHHHDAPNNPDDPDAQTAKKANPPTYEAVRTATALYVVYAGGQQEYYDLSKDPYELHDLGGSAAPAAIKSTLSALQNCHGTTACQHAARAG